VRRVALVVLASSAAGCVEVLDEGAPWMPLDARAPELVAERGPPPDPRDAPLDRLRVVTWNVHFGADVDALATAFAASVESSRAQVVLVQEIEAHATEDGPRTARLARALGMTWVYVPARATGEGSHGLAVLSRYPLEEVAVRELPYIDQAFHARSRIAIAADVVLGAQRVRVVNVHLDVRIGAADRVRQLRPAVVDVAEDFVIGGDFNTNPWVWVEGTVPLVGTEAIVGQEQAAVIDGYLGDNGFASAVSVETATMRLPAFQIRTDDVYARGYPILAADVEHVDGSDHWPVWADIGL
jgi:endonuclease/exonuclease/phosphatase family metal-dependent hydrolase